MTTYIDNKYLRFHGELQNNKYVDQQLREYFPNYDYKGIFFDVGAFEPITISNSHHFYMNGWEVYSFEAIPCWTQPEPDRRFGIRRDGRIQ